MTQRPSTWNPGDFIRPSDTELSAYVEKVVWSDADRAYRIKFAPRAGVDTIDFDYWYHEDELERGDDLDTQLIP